MNAINRKPAEWIENIRIEKGIIPQSKMIKEDNLPIFLWGCGALAIQVYEFCKEYGINIEGCFVDIEVKKEDFEGLHIFKLDQLVEKNSKFSVIIGHSNYAEGVKKLKRINNIKNIYCLSTICYNKADLVSPSFLKNKYWVLNDLYSDLQDEKSKECLTAYFESRINDKAEYMFSYFDKGMNYYINDVINLNKNETLLDIGACTGSAIWSFVEAVQGIYKSVVALEPDKDNYSSLISNIEERDIKNIVVKQICAYNKNTYVHFDGNRESGGINETSPTYQLYPAATIDSLREEINELLDVTIIKINFAFSVSEVLEGAKKLLQERKPQLIIRIGFDENVMINTYLSIKKINPTYKLYLRYSIGIPQGLTIFAI